MEINRKRLIVILGATAVGKTAVALQLAKSFSCPIVSADSRQIYREIPIGTAAPNKEELALIPHHFIAERSIQEPYSASMYEQDALERLDKLFQKHSTIILSGGSMMYIDALCNGIDDMPDVKEDIRAMVYKRYETEGLEGILEELKVLDPIYYNRVDKQNYKRVLHGYEVCLSTGKAFSSFHKSVIKERPFDIIKIGLTREREELYQRINKRVLMMIEEGLEEEARKVYPFRELNALNTVGFKEMFAYFDGEMTLQEAIRRIQKNSRVYARKQLTWWKKDDNITWFSPNSINDILAYLSNK